MILAAHPAPGIVAQSNAREDWAAMRLVPVRRLATMAGSVLVLVASIVLYLHPHVPVLLQPSPSTGHASPAPPRSSQSAFSRLRLLQPLTASTAIVWVTAAPAGERLYATSDQGTTWSEIPLPSLTSQKYGFQAIDRRHLAVQLGHGVTTTQDGGRSWQEVALPPSLEFGPGARFIDPENGWYLDLTAYPGEAAQPTSMWWTSDGARTWTQLWKVDAAHPNAGEIPLDGTKYVLGFRDRLNGWMVIRSPNTYARLLRTQDGGRTWSNLGLAVEATTFEAIDFLGDGSAVLTGRSDTGAFALMSPDGGETWGRPVAVPRDEGRPGLSRNQPAFADRSNWFVASGLNLNVTTNAGRTWTVSRPVIPTSITALHDLWFFGATGWATATDDRGAETVLTTSDAAHSWHLATTPGLT